jgi:hypothetical protein
MRNRTTSLLAVGLVFTASSAAVAKVPRVWNDLSPGPRVVGYDAEKDEVLHQESIISHSALHRPGGDHSYSGNRLEAFRFRGKTGRGGIYDALEDYKLRFDPRKYQYRRR